MFAVHFGKFSLDFPVPFGLLVEEYRHVVIYFVETLGAYCHEPLQAVFNFHVAILCRGEEGIFDSGDIEI